jgi:hypothetical protein
MYSLGIEMRDLQKAILIGFRCFESLSLRVVLLAKLWRGNLIFFYLYLAL